MTLDKIVPSDSICTSDKTYSLTVSFNFKETDLQEDAELMEFFNKLGGKTDEQIAEETTADLTEVEEEYH